MPFQTALSGLNAASADLRVTGNNVANSGTTGFKESRAEFADIFNGISSTAIGAGVRLTAVTQQFTQGNIDFTGNNLDLALNGEGFFVVDDGGVENFTRDGSFQVDRDGFIVNSAGKRLQTYPVLDQAAGTFNRGALGPLQLSTTESAPQATSGVDAEINLASNADDLTAIPFSTTDPSSYNFTTSMTLYDSLGGAHVGTLFFRNVGALSWESYLAVDGTQVGAAQAMTFNADGSLATPVAPVNYGSYVPSNGAAAISPDFSFSGATQYGQANTVTALRQNGYASGRLTGIDIDAQGIVQSRFTNGQSVPLGRVAIASFANPQGLRAIGDNAWIETFAAGEALYGVAGESDLGTVQSGGLEGSNVDIAAQLVNLIAAQRNFQANAQVISTADDITQTIINIR